MTTDDKQTPDPTTPALLSAARLGEIAAEHRRVAAWLSATCAPASLERPTAERAVTAIGDLLAHITEERAMHLSELAEEHGRHAEAHGAITAELAGAHDVIARLEVRHLDALTAPAPADGGEALGRMLNEIRSRLIRRALDGYPGRAGVEEEMAKIDVESAVALYQRGHAAACARAANILADRDAEIARLTAERDTLAVELTEARATAARANENEAVAREMMTKCADREMATLAAWVRAKEAAEDDARREGAREERRLCMADAQEVEDEARGNSEAGAVAGALRVKMAICARGEGQGS